MLPCLFLLNELINSNITSGCFLKKGSQFMDFFFDPKGVAVVGATPEPHTGGHSLLTNLSLGYKGPAYPVNPKYDEILGFRCYPRITDIGGPLDLALIL